MLTAPRIFRAIAVCCVFAQPVLAADWTSLPLRPGARAIYVRSSLGSDTNPGTEAAPLATLAAGFAAVQHLRGDHVYLRRGDLFLGAHHPLEQVRVLGPVPGRPGHIWHRPAPGDRSRHRQRPRAQLTEHSGDGRRRATDAAARGDRGHPFAARQRDFRTSGFTTDGSPGLFVHTGFPTVQPGQRVIEGLLVEDCKFELFTLGIQLQGNVFLRPTACCQATGNATPGMGIQMGNIRSGVVRDNVVLSGPRCIATSSAST